MRKAILGLLMPLSLSFSCGESDTAEPSKRPSRVPSDAIWAGGLDGGPASGCQPYMLMRTEGEESA
jgi:hypothetical protein